jgi:spore maturation protein CgeB
VNIKVLVCSASPDQVNNNSVLRGYVGRGFSDILPEGNVMTCSFDFAVEAAKRFHPDLVVVFGSCMPTSCVYTSLRTYCARSSVTLAFWLHDDPYEFDLNYKIYQYADFIFSNDKWAVTHINHPNVFHLPLAADRQAHFQPIRSEMDRDVFFCGVGFPNRRQLLADCEDALSSYRVEVFGAEWPESLAFCRNTRLSNEILPSYYASSMTTLNVGRRFNLANSKYQLDATTPGPRTFEAAMAGAVQCAYLEGLELADYFIFGEEILVFDSPSELRTLVDDLRKDSLRRMHIAEKSQARALKDHTYAKRAQELLRCCGYSMTELSVMQEAGL